MLSLRCTKCNYYFEKEDVPKACPYCSEEGAIEKTKSAQDFLDEV